MITWREVASGCDMYSVRANGLKGHIIDRAGRRERAREVVMGQVDHCYLVGWVGVIFYYLSLSSLQSVSAIASRGGLWLKKL